jgi:hypothetical protein
VANVATSQRRRRGPSARRPSTGPETAPTSSVTVSAHWAVASETPCSAAMTGTSGAPSVATAVVASEV